MIVYVIEIVEHRFFVGQICAPAHLREAGDARLHVVPSVTLKWLEENACTPDTEEDILDSLKYSVQGRPQVAALSRAFCNERTNPFHILDAQLATFSGEVLFVHGDRDPIMPVDLAFAMSRSVPRSYIWVEPGGTHIFPMKSEQSKERFLAIADAFFGGRLAPKPH